MKLYLLTALLLLASSAAIAQVPKPIPETGTDVTDTNQNSGLPIQNPIPGGLVLKPATDYIRPNAATRHRQVTAFIAGSPGVQTTPDYFFARCSAMFLNRAFIISMR